MIREKLFFIQILLIMWVCEKSMAQIIDPHYSINFKTGFYLNSSKSKITESAPYTYWGIEASFDLNQFVGVQFSQIMPFIWPISGGVYYEASENLYSMFQHIMRKPSLYIHQNVTSGGINVYIPYNDLKGDNDRITTIPIYLGLSRVNLKISEVEGKFTGSQICSGGNCQNLTKVSKNTLSKTHSNGIYLGLGYRIIKESVEGYYNLSFAIIYNGVNDEFYTQYGNLPKQSYIFLNFSIGVYF